MKLYPTAKGRGVHLYARNPEKSYAFESIGRVIFWDRYQKVIEIAGVMYTLTMHDSSSCDEAK